MLSPNKSFVSLGFILIVLATGAYSNRCYVCGPTNMGYEYNCKHLNSSNQDEFMHDCVNNDTGIFYGCSTHYYNDGEKVRDCGEVKKMNDCKVANHVEYCYCTKDLCNGFEDLRLDDSYESKLDDEDLSEGSGGIIKDIASATEINVIIPVTQPTSTASIFYGTIIVMMASMFPLLQ